MSSSQFTAGSKIINTSDPRFRIVDSSTGPEPFGRKLHKMGSTTGWTFGYVGRSCVYMWNTAPTSAGLWMICQNEFNAAGAGGDSGAPVFGWYTGGSGHDVQLSGVISMGYMNGAYVNPLIYSPQILVQYELVQVDYATACPGGTSTNCYLGLTVSAP